MPSSSTGTGHELQPEQLCGTPRVDLAGVLHRDPNRPALARCSTAEVADHLEHEPLALREPVRDDDVPGGGARRADAVEVARERFAKLDRPAPVDVAQALRRSLVQHPLERPEPGRPRERADVRAPVAEVVPRPTQRERRQDDVLARRLVASGRCSSASSARATAALYARFRSALRVDRRCPSRERGPSASARCATRVLPPGRLSR